MGWLFTMRLAGRVDIRELSPITFRRRILSNLERTHENDSLNAVPNQYLERLKVWHWARVANQTAWILLSVTGVLVGLAVSSFSADLEKLQLLPLFGFLGAACTALLSLLKPNQLGDKFLAAWRVLDSACRKYKHFPGTPKSILEDAIETGESIIGTSTPVTKKYEFQKK